MSKKKKNLKKPLPQIEIADSRCPKCGSSRRGKINRTSIQEFAGMYEGQPFTHIVRRWTSCAEPDCLQCRVDRQRVNLPGQKPHEVEEAFRTAENSSPIHS